MDVKTRELIAIGASVAVHCFPFLDYHLAEAKKLGVSSKEILQAVRVGIMVMNGAGQKMVERVRNLFSGTIFNGDESCSV